MSLLYHAAPRLKLSCHPGLLSRLPYLTRKPIQLQLQVTPQLRRFAASSVSLDDSRTPTTPAIPPPPITSNHNLPTLSCFSLQGKTVIITGGARGLGLEMAKGFVSSGAGVALVDLDCMSCLEHAGI
jgi:short chain dehydrogenase